VFVPAVPFYVDRLPRAQYAYLLGLYLGDGWVVAMKRGSHVLRISLDWKHWPAVFPQHGSGPKHTRQIILADWQRTITSAEPRALVRGLIHSDGCRFIAAQRVGGKTYRYSRYAFSNRSEDIKAIFCAHLDLLGIGWTRPNEMSIAIDRRAEVAKLDAFVGPKR
jgi:hypothetical protein